MFALVLNSRKCNTTETTNEIKISDECKPYFYLEILNQCDLIALNIFIVLSISLNVYIRSEISNTKLQTVENKVELSESIL